MAVIFVLFVIALFVWVGFTQVTGRQQLSVTSPHDLARTKAMVGSKFGIAWSRVPGRGDDNFKPRLRMHTPTLSVRYEQTAEGTEVQLWCSNYDTYLGLMIHAQLMWRKKLSVARSVTQESPSATSGGHPADGLGNRSEGEPHRIP